MEVLKRGQMEVKNRDFSRQSFRCVFYFCHSA